MSSINRKNLPLNALRAFEAVARKQSFRGGASSLTVTQSAVSRHIAVLEELLGERLFLRRSQGIELTEAGVRLLKAVSRGFDGIEQAMNEVRGGKSLRIHVPPAFLHSLAMPVIRSFRAANGDVTIDVTSSVGTGVQMEGLDLAIVFDRPRVAGAIRDLLWNIQLTPVCAPQRIEHYRSAGMETLLASDDLLHVRIADEPANLLWSRYAAEAGHSLDHSHGVIFETMTLAVDCAAAGTGVALADVKMYADRIASGELVALFPINAEVGYGYYLEINAEAMSEAIVRRFRASLIEHFSAAAEAAD